MVSFMDYPVRTDRTVGTEYGLLGRHDRCPCHRSPHECYLLEYETSGFETLTEPLYVPATYRYHFAAS